MELHIYKDSDPILRKPTESVADFDMELQDLIDNMIETMRKRKGIGLSAPQVGISKKIIIAEFDEDNLSEKEEEQKFPLTIICNPQIISKKNKCKMVEGCLSFPGLELLIERPKDVVIEGQDRYGKNITIDISKLLSRVIQHEIDHLNSTLFIDHLKELKIIFFGSGEFGIKILNSLILDPQYIVSKIYTTENSCLKRGRIIDKNLIKKIAKKNKIDTSVIKNLSDSKIISEITRLNPDVGVVADFGLIIPKNIFSIPKYGLINIHPSLLPKYRGPSPIKSAILNGDKKTGVTLIKISEKLDQGDIIAQSEIKLKGSENYPILFDYLSETGASLLLNCTPYYISGDIKLKPQNSSQSSMTKKFSKKDGQVTLATGGTAVDRMVRAFNPWPGVYIVINSKRFQITATHLNNESELVIDRIKPEGKSEMTYQEYLRGYKKELTFAD